MYLEMRRLEIDKSEWWDILWSLKALRVPKSARIIELGAGEGLLMDFLKKKGYKNVVGYDKLGDNVKVIKADLEEYFPANGDVYVFQHFLEHINQDRAVELVKLAYETSRYGVIGILPGHLSGDPTHVVNHYHYEDLVRIVKFVKPKFWFIRPDLGSYIYPSSRDWLLILSKVKIGRTMPLPLQLSVFYLKVCRKILVRRV